MIKICGKEYSVEIVPDSPIFGDLIGLFIGEEARILIRSKLNKQVTDESILHESIHAIAYGLGLNLSESEVTALSTALYDLLRSNGFGFNFSKTIDKA